MTTLRTDAAGAIVVESPQYRLEVAATGALARLSSPSGRPLASLRLLAALDAVDGLDETLSVGPPRVVDGSAPTIELERRSTRWERATLTLVCADDTIELRTAVQGRGALADVHLLGGRSLVPGRPTGFLPSGSALRTLFSPNPGSPRRLLRAAAEAAVIGVVGDSAPGRGHWFFTPAPLYLALTGADGITDPASPAEDGWLGIGLAAPVEELTFGELVYTPADEAFSLRLDYDGHTVVDGEFRAPSVLLSPGVPDPYTGLRRHRDDLVERGAAPPVQAHPVPAWWLEPIFCGWGAQCHLAAVSGRRAPELCTRENYDAFLDVLERHAVVPGTIVIDDKWQAAYGTCTPDERKWPDLKQWIAARHARGQRVLLWWKAWDAEGLPPDHCITNPDGAAVATDPTNPALRDALGRAVREMLAADGLDADGLKIDFTGASPSGRLLATHGRGWGIALLHQLLAVVRAAAKEAKPDALLITHTPHPAFVDVTDMLRLNDMLRLEDVDPRAPVVPQMTYRARVARAACPELAIDTDDWCVPDHAAWREYLEAKPQLGVPALYYATHLDLAGEALSDDDYAAIRRAWAAWRSSAAAR